MKQPLFTSNFKVYIKRIVAFTVVLAVVYGIALIMADALSNVYDTRNGTQKVTSYQMGDFYKLPENSLDVLILGSSHAMCSYNPEEFKSAYDLKAFNLGTALQQPDTAYFLLCEVLKTQRPKYLIYDVYFKVMTEKYSTEQATTVLKELAPSKNKFHMLMANLPLDDKVSFYNNWLNPFARIQNVMENPQKKEDMRTEAYRGAGFYSSTGVVSKEALLEENHPYPQDFEGFDERQVRYLKKMIQLAQAEGIEVILSIAPFPPTIYRRIDYIDEIVRNTADIATEYGVPLYDFAKSCSQILADEDFADQGHLNQSGNKKFMQYFIANIAEFQKYKKA